MRRDAWKRNCLAWTAQAACALVLAAVPAAAQIPDQFTNLQVLPKDIKKEKLIEVMRDFAGGLGVRCTYCHVGEGGPTLANMEFASDEMEKKKTARLMLQMVRAINGDYLMKLGPEHKTRVECVTCHRGMTEPETLDALLDEVIEEKGADAAVARYRELRERYYGHGGYDFSERTLNRLGENLLKEKKAREAAMMLDLNAEFHPDSAFNRYLLGEAYLAGGDKEKAKASFQKALELAPENPQAKKRLEELNKPQS